MAVFINTIDALGDEVVMDSIINRTITEFKDNTLETIGDYAFYKCTALKEVNLPNVLYLHTQTFAGCSALETVNLPECVGLGPNRYDNKWFDGCTSLKAITLPKMTVVGQQYSFSGCTRLEYVDLPSATKIPTACFDKCTAMKVLILRRTEVIAEMAAKNALGGSTALKIYVPSALVGTYKAATNWSDYASQFRALEDYTVDGTTTGELDETKI